MVGECVSVCVFCFAVQEKKTESASMSSYAQSMIKRFREAAPTSRTDRENDRAAGNLQEMWWVAGDGIDYG